MAKGTENKIIVSFAFGCDACGSTENIGEGDVLCVRCKTRTGKLSAVDAVRSMNRNLESGRVISAALDRHLNVRERELAIAALGWEPETPGDPGDRYAASTGELRAWAGVKPANTWTTDSVAAHAADIRSLVASRIGGAK